MSYGAIYVAIKAKNPLMRASPLGIYNLLRWVALHRGFHKS